MAFYHLDENMPSLRDHLSHVVRSYSPPYELTEVEQSIVVQQLSSTFESLYAGTEEDTRNEHFVAIKNRLGYLADSVFNHVSPLSQSINDFNEDVERRTARTRDGRSVHLELGTFNVWPDSRADEYVTNERIGDVIRLDMNPKFDLDVAGSVTAMPFADESIDRIHSNSLFEHVPYPHEIIREAFRVLRPGGYILTVVPFHFVEHGCPGDFLRYTGQFFEQVGGDAGFVDIKIDTRGTSGVYYTSHQFIKSGIVMEPDSHPMCRGAQLSHVYTMVLTAALQSLDTYFHANGASHWHTTFAIMSKPGEYVSRPDAPDRSKVFLDRFKDLICPRTGLPLKNAGGELVSADGRFRYPVVDGKPNLFVMHGFNSAFTHRASSKEVLSNFERAGHIPFART